MSPKRPRRRLKRFIRKHQPVSTVIMAVLGLLVLIVIGVVARVVFVQSDSVASSGCSNVEGSLMLRGRSHIDRGGETRTFNVTVSRNDLGRPVPMVVAVGDDQMNRDQFDLLTDMPEVGRREGFITLTPERTDVGEDWDLTPNGEDISLISEIIDSVEERLCVHTERVYLVGFGTGGALAQKLACTEPERFRGLAVVGGLVDIEPCEELPPTPLIVLHGTDDEAFPLDGSHPEPLADRLAPIISGDDPTRLEITEGWAERNGCRSGAEALAISGETALTRWECPAGLGVDYYQIERGRHVWPNPRPAPDVPAATAVRHSRLDASTIIWEFFRDQWATRS